METPYWDWKLGQSTLVMARLISQVRKLGIQHSVIGFEIYMAELVTSVVSFCPMLFSVAHNKLDPVLTMCNIGLSYVPIGSIATLSRVL
jgi:hypothetical protein